MKLKMLVSLVAAFAVFNAGNIFAQESTDVSSLASAAFSDSEEEGSSPDFGLGLSIGMETVNGTNYTVYSLQPDLDLGMFGIGLDLKLAFDSDYALRGSDYQTWEDYLAIIKYVRYGNKGVAPVYAKIGCIDDFSLGHGLIMNRYSNMLNYPADRVLGIAFDLDFDNFGLESMVRSMNFDVFGGRIFFRPLINTSIPIVKTLEIGGTFAMDAFPTILTTTNEASVARAADTNVMVYGLDVGMTVLDNLMVSMLAYADVVAIDQKGVGAALGAAGSVISWIPYRLEARYNEDQFDFTYFDSFYDATRSTKYDALDNITNGYFGWLFSSGISILPNEDGEATVGFDITIEDSFNDTTQPELLCTIYATKDLLQIFDLAFTWSKMDIASFSDVFQYEAENSILQLDLNYWVSEDMSISMSYQRTFAYEDGVLVPDTQTSINTSVSFF